MWECCKGKTILRFASQPPTHTSDFRVYVCGFLNVDASKTRMSLVAII
jgi:hypothetical protein